MTPDRARDIAGGLGWLSRQPQGFRDAILRETDVRRLCVGDIFTSVADPPAGITCVVDGFLDVLVAPGPFPTRLVHLARAGWWFGDVATISKAPRPASVVARTESWVLHLPERKVWRIAEDHAEGWRRFAELTVAHFDNALFLAASLAMPDLTHRLAALICWLTGAGFFCEAVDELPLTREEIGEIAGLSRNTTGRVLQGLVREGLIDARYGRLIVTDRGGLEAVIHHGAGDAVTRPRLF